MFYVGSFPRQRGRTSGFTLVELLLAVFLLALFLGALVLSFGSLQPNRRLQEGADRLESLLRYAKAQAAYQSRRLQIQFVPDESDPLNPRCYLIDLAWEPDPYVHPGIFVPMTVPGWDMNEINEQIAVDHVVYPQDAMSSPSSAAEEPLEALLPLTFFPDGSVDSADILLISREKEDRRKMWIYVHGLTGELTHEWVEPSDESNGAEDAAAAAFP